MAVTSAAAWRYSVVSPAAYVLHRRRTGRETWLRYRNGTDVKSRISAARAGPSHSDPLDAVSSSDVFFFPEEALGHHPEME